MRSTIKYLPFALAASLLLAACGSSSSSGGTTSASSPAASGGSAITIKTASVGSLGTVLVNDKGMTLYHLSGERAGKLICTSSTCVHIWIPLTVPAHSKPAGSVSGLGMIKRPNGVEQVAYKGQPLYTFVKDTAPGQAKGEGIKDVGTWTVVSTKAKSGGTAAAPASSTSSAGGGGYSY